MKKINPGVRLSAWLPWTIVTLIAASCCTLAVLQYRWITEFSTAERDRMRADLQSRLALLSRDFNDQIVNASRHLLPSARDLDTLGSEKAYLALVDNQPLFKRIAVVKSGDLSKHLDKSNIGMLDFTARKFVRAQWPEEWSSLHTMLAARVNTSRPVTPLPLDPSDATLLVFPRFAEVGGGPSVPPFPVSRSVARELTLGELTLGEPTPGEPTLGQPGFHEPKFSEPQFHEEEWLVVELDQDYIRGTMLPALAKKYLEEPNGLHYDTELVLNPAQHGSPADASVPLLTVEFRLPQPQRRPPPEFGRGPARGNGRGAGFGPPPAGFEPRDGRGFGRRGGPPREGPRVGDRQRDGSDPRPDFARGPSNRGDGPDGDRKSVEPNRGRRGPPPGARRPPAPIPEQFLEARQFANARWRLDVRNRASSLDALTARARNRNIAISAGLLLLILAIVGLLLRVSRQSQRLAESHMNFVAGVSHELRTPLTVIRTAAYNLRGKLSNRPDQVEKYGKLIQEESEKLGALVEQVLQFASGQAGHDIRNREPVDVEDLIDDSLQWSLETLESRGIRLEKQIDAGLPPARADPVAMKHALRNLIDNALKYGTESSHWIGVCASAITTARGPAIEIRVADHGPGIPAAEQAHIFDPFFRGQRAISDQIHGTGLGLNLTRRIIEAHGGTIEVESSADSGTVFIVRIPAGANSLSPIGVTT